MGRPGTTEAFLYCASCPVRDECLAESLVPIRYSLRPDRERKTAIRIDGIWGGTTLADRMRVKDLSFAEAVEELEAGFPERLRNRIDAVELRIPVEGPHKHCKGVRCKNARQLLEWLRRSTASFLPS